MTLPRLSPLTLAAVLTFAMGCSNKGDREGKVTVVVGKNLQALDVTLVDWRYSASEQTFGVKLKTAKPVPKHTYLILSGPGLSNVQSLLPSGEAINEGRWVDYGGSKALGNPIANFPTEGEITIDTR
ncbi:hypothetical protein [Limnoglobus roseus]|uniref:Uncharacterized protein n=1 Tax=Limnoglobus roseus TaxID=2598579 RepID=A0A5C1ALR1_9BACT|nr:hypothetical protein [Limnoglobus roseus]QEL18916.1 hypothetical protein PX52LOC_05966 [Limnoglobus roseus]